MEPVNDRNGLPPSFNGNNGTQQAAVWRPWTGTDSRAAALTTNPQNGENSAEKHPKAPQVVHPVKLFWPKSRCFDYLYQDAELLLRSYPVQASICLYEDSSSDEDSEEEDEEMEKELN